MSVADEIKQRLDVVSVVGAYAPLSRAGRNLKALCPFHQEKTPSFYVFPETQTWRCFGACGTGGDLFSFVMKKEGIDFGEALRVLAAKAGVALEERRVSPEAQEQHARLKEVVQSAAIFFHNTLLNSAEATPARAYVEKRGISVESIRTFMLGHGPQGWSGLLDHLQAQGFKPEEMLEAGLITKRDSGSGYYDRFRDRLIFPIQDVNSTVVAFGGRALKDEDQPKYLNSPQTPLFDKSGTIYALNFAKDVIRSQRQAVIVEGYMDALMAHQHGFKNVVASMGTSLTEKQVQLLSRYTTTMVLALDPDAAGQAATLRGLEVDTGQVDVAVPSYKGHVQRKQVGGRQVISRLPEGVFNVSGRRKVDARIMTLPEGLDPDELVKSEPARWAQLVESSVPMLDFLFTSTQQRFDLSTPKGKADAVDAVVPFLAHIPNAVEQAHYLQRLATMVSVDERTLRASLPARKRSKPEAIDTTEVRHQIQQLDVLEDYCLALLHQFHHLTEHADALRSDHFLSTEGRELFEAWKAGEEPDEFLASRLERIQEVALPPLTDSMSQAALAQCIHRLEERRLLELKKQQRLQLAEDEAEQGASAVAVAAYERWKDSNNGQELPLLELTVNRDIQDLMKRKGGL